MTGQSHIPAPERAATVREWFAHSLTLAAPYMREWFAHSLTLAAPYMRAHWRE
jgi:hypothetical protein